MKQIHSLLTLIKITQIKQKSKGFEALKTLIFYRYSLVVFLIVVETTYRVVFTGF